MSWTDSRPKTHDPKGSQTMSIKFRCECGQSYSAKESLAGKDMKCRNCSGTVRVPATSSEESLDAYNLISDESVTMSHATPSVQPVMAYCLQCSTEMPATAVLCVSCGYHQTLGKKIETSTKSKKMIFGGLIGAYIPPKYIFGGLFGAVVGGVFAPSIFLGTSIFFGIWMGGVLGILMMLGGGGGGGGGGDGGGGCGGGCGGGDGG